MGSCCGTEKRDAGSKEPKSADHVATQNGFQDVPAGALRMQPVAFDVVVPQNHDNNPNASGGAGPTGAPNMSYSMFNASMHTVGDASYALDRTSASFDPFAATMNNMSFTNSFKAVDKNAVREFMKNVAQLAQQGGGKTGLLEESMLSASIAPDGNRSLMGGGTTSNTMTPEDLKYIAAGATLKDRITRLQEVQSVLRQSIEGAWRVDNMLLQLACCQVLPTLRQRRRAYGTNAAAKSNANGRNAAAGSQRAAAASHQPVLVIYAQGMQMDQSLSMGASGSMGSPQQLTGNNNQPRPDEFSPPSQPNMPHGNANPEMSISHTRAEPQPGTKVEQYEMLALTCRDINAQKCPGSTVENETWDFLAQPNTATTLNEGLCIFRFKCSSLADIDDETKAITDAVINLSSFQDEVAENNTPKVNVHDPEDAAKYIGIFVKTMYMLPGIAIENITKDLMVSTEYQKACQPSENKVQECEFEDTFRLTMTIIRFIFSLTIQFKVSEITDPAVLDSLSVCDGMVPAKALMLERTKRHIANVDATAKVRSLLLYYPVNDGVLVNNHTIVLNTSLPKVVSKIMNTFGSQGASQSVQTTKLTRAYLAKRFGDTRNK